jgi:hypothetical protein
MKTLFQLFAAFAITAASAHGTILWSGLVGGPNNITISTTFTGVFIDVDNLSNPSSPTQQTGWDLNAFFGGEGFASSARFQPARASNANNSAIINLTTGSLVDSSLIYFNGAAGSDSHIGNNAGQFVSGSTGFIGFKLIDNSNNGPFFGWMRVNLSNTGATGSIIDWAYETNGNPINVGVIPEPTSLALLALGGSLCAFRRNRGCK